MPHPLSILRTALVVSFLSVSTAAFADGILDANTATVEEMAGLPHMDEYIAGAIVSNRPYATIGALHELLGADLDDDQLTELYAHLFVPINLNTADETHILLIPGVGKRMAHEFEEYRPYSSIAQFRREMAKYVDEAEVARLEQYVTLD